MDDIGDMLGQNFSYKLQGKVKECDDCVVIVPDMSTVEFSKYMGAYHSYGEVLNEGCEHVAIFPFPIQGHGRICFHPKNKFYNDDNYYFMLMTVEHEDRIKNCLRRNNLDSIQFEIQPTNNEADFGNI